MIKSLFKESCLIRNCEGLSLSGGLSNGSYALARNSIAPLFSLVFDGSKSPIRIKTLDPSLYRLVTIKFLVWAIYYFLLISCWASIRYMLLEQTTNNICSLCYIEIFSNKFLLLLWSTKHRIITTNHFLHLIYSLLVVYSMPFRLWKHKVSVKWLH
jgi:hypothetical protein